VSTLDRATLESFCEKLGGEPSDLVRQDAHFAELGVDPGSLLSAEAVVDLLLEHPRIMQRPVCVLGDRAVIARPAELVLTLLD